MFTYKNSNGISYAEYIPQKVKNTKLPVLIYLHGAGERGSNLDRVKVHGPLKEIAAGRLDADFIVIAPQCEENKTWWDYSERLYAWISEYIKQPHVDRQKVYLTGNSMGGYGTWAFAMAHPELFAAIVPICGGGMAWNAGVLQDVPVWAFHCVGDAAVKCIETVHMVESVKNSSRTDVKITVYPRNEHDAWTETYQDAEVYSWLLSKKKEK